MINCYSLNGKLYDTPIEFNDFNEIKLNLEKNLDALNSLPFEVIVLIFDAYSKKLSSNRELLKIEGAPFLSFYLKKANIESLIDNSLKNKKCLDEFIDIGNGKFIKAQGRGIVCHWIAGNIPTLAIYSMLQSLIAKNLNIIRVSKKTMNTALKLFELLNGIKVVYDEREYSSDILLKSISFVYFESSDKLLNRSMSQAADARVVWGGEDAVNLITSLPKKTTCKDLIFGPKYSFAVFDKSAIESNDFENYITKFVLDIVLFGQQACSSPHVLFVEKSKMPLKKIVQVLSQAFVKINNRYPNILDQSTAAKIINERGLYGLSLNKDLYCPKGLEYTILINNDFTLEEPIGGRCIFVKQVDNIFDIKKLITRRVQTIGIASKDRSRVLKFADEVTSLGVDRIVSAGIMNIYDSPWDGYYMINELIRWCLINLE
ncbi:acyl-CoA reductase [Clostridium sp. JN-1]|uniref:acyl-CoA reductase n=1 Tax=Clostridium sp. JN-1 TaxID=2483110 RepID=UPI000F0B82A0|nr:acyl-CoA reductase [Clostridium sp. JN-1]